MRDFEIELNDMSLEQVFFGAILVGLDGYDDADTVRPIEVLRRLRSQWPDGLVVDVMRYDGATVASLRAFAERKFEEVST